MGSRYAIGPSRISSFSCAFNNSTGEWFSNHRGPLCVAVCWRLRRLAAFLRWPQAIEECRKIAKTDRSKIELKVILGLLSKRYGGFGAVAKSPRCTDSRPFLCQISLLLRVSDYERHKIEATYTPRRTYIAMDNFFLP